MYVRYAIAMSRKYIVFSVVCMCSAVLLVVLLFRPSAAVLTVTFLDVGQGDAIFIESPTGGQMLVDGGKGAAVLRELGRTMHFFDRTIDVVLATHPDMDHIGGLPDVLQRYAVGQVLISGVEDAGSDNVAFLHAVEHEGLVPHSVRAGEVLSLGGGVFVQVLFPKQDMPDSDQNAASVVVRVVYGGTSFLLTGDAPSGIEQYLAAEYGSGLHADVLKLGHHGSRTSSSEVFLDAVAPQYVVVSAGCTNSYGHPHEDVLQRVRERGSVVRQTCGGRVVFQSDGERVMD